MVQKWFLTLLIWIALGSVISAQTRLSVDINDPVYTLIEIGEVKGILTKLSQVKPYTRQEIFTMLSRMKAREYELSAQERKILDAYLERFATTFHPEAKLIDNVFLGGVDFGNQAGHARIGLRIGGQFHVDVKESKQHYANVPIEFYVQGDFLNSMFSYYVNAILATGQDSIYPFAHPGQTPAMGMGFWQRYFGGDSAMEIWHTQEMSWWASAPEMTPELTGQFWDDRIMLRMGLLTNREVGSGLSLSRDAAGFSALEFSIRPVEWFNFYYITGSLSGGRGTLGDDRDTEFHNAQLVQNTKMYSMHMGEFFLSDYFYANIWESIIWGNRFNVNYLIPVNIYSIAQNMSGDLDNVALGAGIATIIPNVMKVEANIFMDEFQGKGIGTSPRNMLAWDVGARFHVPWLTFSQMQFKYTKINPYVYTHYPQNYADYGTNIQGDKVLIDTGFTNRGKALGSYLKPNSDQFLLGFQTLPLPGLSASFEYTLVRHGNSAPHKYWLGKDGRYYTDDEKQAAIDRNGDDFFSYGQVWAWDRNGITGELNGFLDYRQWDRNPWQKKFLKDGIYDWTNAFSINLSYDLRFLSTRKDVDFSRQLPVILSLGYTFAHTFYDFNGRNFDHISDPADLAEAMAWARRFGYTYETTIKNIFSFSISIYPR